MSTEPIYRFSASFQVFSDPTAENRFGRAKVQCFSCLPAAGSGQPPSIERVFERPVAEPRSIGLIG